MAVSCTTTLNTGFGTGLVVEGAGFLLNNEMDDFSAKAGVPNVYGVTGSAANEIAPGKRPLSSMTPTMVFDPEGQLMLVLGSPGKVARQLDPESARALEKSAAGYVARGREYLRSLRADPRFD